MWPFQISTRGHAAKGNSRDLCLLLHHQSCKLMLIVVHAVRPRGAVGCMKALLGSLWKLRPIDLRTAAVAAVAASLSMT